VFRRLKCIPAVIAILLIFSSAPARAADSIVRLSETDQAAVQKFFDEIYEKIRLPTDPEKPPQIVLMRSNRAAAYVYPNDPSQVFFNADYLLSASSLDVIAGTYAHELTHFELEQRKRGGNSDGAFLNELDAQTRGIVARLARVGQIDPVTKQPQAAVFNLEAVIKDYERNDGYSSTHGNAGDLALGLKGLFAIERYRRTFPVPQSMSGLGAALRARMFLAAALVIPEGARKQEVAPVRQQVEKAVADIRKSAYLALKDIHRRAKKIYDPRQGKADAPTSKQRDALGPLIEELKHQGSRLGARAGSHPQDYSDLSQLPDGIFSDLHALLSHFPKQGSDYFRGLMEENAKQERYFLDLSRGSTIGYEDLFPNQRHTTWKLWLVDSSGAELRVLLLRHEKALLEAFQKNPWQHLEAMTVAARYPEFFPVKGPLVQTLEEFGRRVTPDDIDRHLSEGNGKISGTDLVYLDWDPIRKTHRFPVEVRDRIADRTEDSLSIQAQLYKGEPENFRRRVHGWGPEPDFSHLFGYLLDAKETFTPSQIDSLFAPLFEKAAARARNAKLFETPEELAEAVAQLRQTAQGILELRPKAEFPIAAIRMLELGTSEYHVLAAEQLIRDHYSKVNKWRPESALSDKLDEHRKKIGSHVNQLSLTPKDAPEGIRRQIGQHLMQTAPFVLTAQMLNSSRQGEVPWAAVFAAASAEQIAMYFPRTPILYHNDEMFTYYNAAARRMTELVASGEATAEHAMDFLLSSRAFLNGSTPDLEKLIEVVEARGFVSGLKLLNVVSPTAFPSPANYLEFVERQLGRETRARVQALADHRRPQTLTDLRDQVRKEVLSYVDPLLRPQVMDKLALLTQATPPEKDLFQVDLHSHDAEAAKAATYLNELLDIYKRLPTEEKLILLEWVRGHRSDLTPTILEKIDEVLKTHKHYVPVQSLEPYIRSRFDALPPTVRGAFFQIAFDGPHGFFKARGWRAHFEAKLFSNLPPEIRSTVQELFSAGLEALPESLRTLAFSLAYAESGNHGTPEQALRLFFSRMGPLMKKLGQNLAFDPHLPESYRAELRKLWDQNESPSWWHVYDLVERQHGKIWEHGYRVISIRNAGSTEIMLEIEGPDGKREIISVQREALLVGNETDRQDLERFVKALSRRWGGKRKYGFLGLLVEDAARTMKQEADPTHKRKMNEAMRLAYRRAAERLSGHAQLGETTLDGWTFKSVDYHDRPLGPGETFPTVSIAGGRPMKDIAQSHPELYRSLSHTLVRLENEAQQDPHSPIDKDRMPGQVFVDVATRTVTLLDPGQASRLSPLVHAARDPFTGAALAANVDGVNEALAPLGISLSWLQRQRLALHLGATEPEVRPLQALHWIKGEGLATGAAENHFWDLVHSLRAKVRLAQWAQDVESPLIKDEWTGLARDQVTTTGVILEICRRVSAASGWE